MYSLGLLCLNNDYGPASTTTRYQLEYQSANRFRLVLPGRARESIRSFKAVRSFNSQFPVFAGTRFSLARDPAIDTRQVSRSGAERVLNTRDNFSAQLSISEILQFNRDSHHTAILSNVECPFAVQTRQIHGRQACARILDRFIHNSC
jgi:hypothetical protein